MCCTDEDFDNITEDQKQKYDLPVFDFFLIEWHLIIFYFFDYSISTDG